MAEGWKQLIEDLRSALGVGSANRPSASETVKDQNTDSAAFESSLLQESKQSAPLEVVTPQEAWQDGNQIVDVESNPPSALRKLFSSTGLIVALVLAVGVSWYVYFGGPNPPAPDVVATFNGGQITVEQVNEHLAVLGHAGDFAGSLTYADYQSVVEHMVLNELVRRWAAEQNMDTSARFKDAMRHISESVTLDEWVASIHQNEMLSAVSESEILNFYNDNQDSFANQTLGEVREQIRQTLAHQNQEKFFDEYVARLRSEATISKNYDLLEIPAPTTEQMKTYYTENSEQFNLAGRALVDRIYVPLEGSGEESDNQARRKAEAARAALQAGAEFAEVAGKYSQEPYTPAGVTLEAGKDDPELVDQAFALSQAGDLSPVIRSSKEYYVLRLREKQQDQQLSFEEAGPKILAALQSTNESTWFEQNANRTLFTIHGDRFTLGQFYHEYQNLPPEMKSEFAGLEGMKRLTDLLIDRMLLLEDAYTKLSDQKNAPLLEEARMVILREMMHEAEVDSRVDVSEEDLKEFYREHKDHFSSPPEARIQTIRIFLGDTADEQQRARKKAEEAYQELVPGISREAAEFDQVAQVYDESDSSSANGSLGEWIRMGDDPVADLLAHPLHEYIYTLPVNAVSQPIEYGQDIYIIKVLERVESQPLDFEEVKDDIRKELESRQHERLDTEVAMRLFNEAHVTTYKETIQKMVESELAP